MARVRYVDPNSSGGNGTTSAITGANAAYVSLASWDSNSARNCVTATDGDQVNCATDGATVNDTSVVSLDNGTGAGQWNTNATYYIEIFGENTPLKRDTAVYALSVNSAFNNAIGITTLKAIVKNIQIGNSNA